MDKHNYSNYFKPNKPRAEEPEILGVDLSPADDVCIKAAHPVAAPIVGIVANCVRLNVREEPSIESDIVTILDKGSEVHIEDSESSEDFYKICTATGIDGFCMKKFIDVKE